MSHIVEMVAVHFANRSGRGRAAYFMSRESARELVDARLAIWGKGAKFINLTKSEAEMHKNALSLTMGAHLVFEAACGSSRHVAIVEGWRPSVRVAA